MFPLEIAVTPAIANASPNVVVHPRYGCPESALAAHVYCTPLRHQSVQDLQAVFARVKDEDPYVGQHVYAVSVAIAEITSVLEQAAV